MASHLQIVTRYLVLTLLFCCIPYFYNDPGSLSVVIAAIILYRLLADYFHFPLPNRPWRIVLMIFIFGVLFWQYRFQTNGFYIGFLISFSALKSLEAQSVRDLRVLVLCNFYVMLTALLLQQTLWVFPYLILAVFANLALMLKLTAPTVSFKGLGKPFLKHFLIALPIALLLFYVFPRFSQPLWRVPNLSQSTTGFSEEMTSGSLSDIATDDSTAMQIIFHSHFKPTFYWRGLVLSQFNGWRWKAETGDVTLFKPLKSLENTASADYEIFLEPHQKKWLFYQNLPVASQPMLMFSAVTGLVQSDQRPIHQRFAYSIIESKPSYQPLTQIDYQKNTYLPLHGNPRLKEWAKTEFSAANKDTLVFIQKIIERIKQEPYWYSLTATKRVGIKANLMDTFWFETQRGYCEEYTGAVAIILRAVGIPARVIVGYHGGQWNPVSQYLKVQQNDAHAWLEYWLEGQGWQHLDPVAFIPPERIDPSLRQAQTETYSEDWAQRASSLPWMTRATFYLESAQFYWERWLLFYNQDTQRILLQKIGLPNWDEIKLLQGFIGIVILMMVIGGIWYVVREHREQDKLLAAYHHLQKKLRRLGVQTDPPVTFAQQLQELAQKYPHQKAQIANISAQYERLRLHQPDDNLRNRQTLLKLFKLLRRSSFASKF